MKCKTNKSIMNLALDSSHSLVVLFILIVIVLETITITIAGSSQADEITSTSNATSFILEYCSNKLDFKTIADFQRFSHLLEQDSIRSVLPRDNLLIGRCLTERESILELSQLIGHYDKLRPCKYSEIKKLEDYAKKHFYTANTKNSNKTPSSQLTIKFFTLFGVNVGISCKLNLLAHLKQADLEADQLDFVYSIASPTGWDVLINELTKKSMKFGGSTHANSNLINKLVRLVPGLTQVDHLDYLNFNHIQDELTRRERFNSSWTGREAGQYQLEVADGTDGMRSKMLDSIEQVIRSCKSLDQFYVNNLLSLAKLSELGLGINYLNDFHESSVLLHKWLAAASFCQLMARVRLTTSGNGQEETKSAPTTMIEFELIHDDKQLESRRELYSYVARMEEISEPAREAAWRTSVSSGQWRQKSEAMFVGNETTSRALKQVKQFFKGLERGFQAKLE